MKITGVRTHVLRAPLKERFGWSLNWTDHRTVTLVEVTTDSGLTGWGEGASAESILTRDPGLVIGRSPFEVEQIYHALRVPGEWQRRPSAPLGPGLDIALWDLMGKALNLPVCCLFGTVYRDRVPVYLTALYRKDWPDLVAGLVAEAESWKAAGFRRMKAKIGYEPSLDVEIVRSLRQALGESIGLAVDSNCAYDVGTAVRLGRQLEEFNLLWWEEPIIAEDTAGYQRLQESLRIPMAAGETGSADWLIPSYIQSRCVDILQPDLEHVGLTGARVLTYLCWLNHIRLIPHNWGTALRTAATLQWMACCPPLTPAIQARDVLFEFDQTENLLRDAVLETPIRFDPNDQSIPVPQGPGLGVTVNRDTIDKFRIGGVEIV